MWKCLLSGILVAVFVTQGTPSEAEFVVMGPGMTTCGKFAEGYRESPNIEIMFFTWAQGYMSGLNQERREGYYDMAALTIESQKSFIMNYCDQHPLARYAEGALKLLLTMPFRPWPPGTGPVAAQARAARQRQLQPNSR